MEAWKDFLDSLATRGGNIFLLALFVVGFSVLVFHALHDAEPNAEARTVVLSTFSTFTGALVGALTGGAMMKKPNGAGNAVDGQPSKVDSEKIS